LGFCVLNFLSILSGFLSGENLTQKGQMSKADQFPKLQLFNDKIDRNTNFAQLTVTKKANLCIVLQVTYNCSIFWRLFFESISLVRENLRELRGNLKHKI
jgi:hypothetical protein